MSMICDVHCFLALKRAVLLKSFIQLGAILQGRSRTHFQKDDVVRCFMSTQVRSRIVNPVQESEQNQKKASGKQQSGERRLCAQQRVADGFTGGTEEMPGKAVKINGRRDHHQKTTGISADTGPAYLGQRAV